VIFYQIVMLITVINDAAVGSREVFWLKLNSAILPRFTSEPTLTLR
jgi:hypothetical protein